MMWSIRISRRRKRMSSISPVRSMWRVCWRRRTSRRSTSITMATSAKVTIFLISRSHRPHPQGPGLLPESAPGQAGPRIAMARNRLLEDQVQLQASSTYFVFNYQQSWKKNWTRSTRLKSRKGKGRRKGSERDWRRPKIWGIAWWEAVWWIGRRFNRWRAVGRSWRIRSLDLWVLSVINKLEKS